MKRILTALTTAFIGFMVFLPVVAAAQFDPFNGVCNGVTDSTVCEDSNVAQSPGSNAIYGRDGVLTKAANIVSIVVGIASVIMIVVGGFKYVTSGGDSGQATSARRTVMFAVVGVLVALFAQAIILFVFDRL